MSLLAERTSVCDFHWRAKSLFCSTYAVENRKLTNTLSRAPIFAQSHHLRYDYYKIVVSLARSPRHGLHAYVEFALSVQNRTQRFGIGFVCSYALRSYTICLFASSYSENFFVRILALIIFASGVQSATGMDRNETKRNSAKSEHKKRGEKKAHTHIVHLVAGCVPVTMIPVFNINRFFALVGCWMSVRIFR